MWPNPKETADLVTFTEEIHNGKLHFLCSESLISINPWSTFSMGLQFSKISYANNSLCKKESPPEKFIPGILQRDFKRCWLKKLSSFDSFLTTGCLENKITKWKKKD